MRATAAILTAALVLTACGTTPSNVEPIGPGTTAPIDVEEPVNAVSAAMPPLRLDLLTDGLAEPVALATRTNDDRIYVAERLGRVMTFTGNALEPDPFLDLTRVVSGPISEQGLLGLTFDPDGDRLFVLYTGLMGTVRVVAYDVIGDAVDPISAQPILSVGQPRIHHQGGAIGFGPDGYLWVGLGDGGGIGDPDGHAQNTATLLGTIVRLDVDAGVPYAVPPDNAFVGSDSSAHEIWAFGLRNPWRFTFDAGFIYVTDVGLYEREEINIVPIDAAGSNFGWSIREGDRCFDATSCATVGLTDPVIALPHERLCAVIGGPVYRGEAIPALRGHFFYGDYCVGWIRSVLFDGTTVVAEHDWEQDLGSPGLITTFGTDPAGEVLVATQDGGLYRIVAGP